MRPQQSAPRLQQSAPPSSLFGGGRRAVIRKKSRVPHATDALVGRRVRVPQRFTEIEDDGDGFCFGGAIVESGERRTLIKFDYTGEVEGWSTHLVREWLEAPLDPLMIAAFAGL